MYIQSIDLDTFASALARRRPNWGTIFEEFKAHPDFDDTTAFSLAEYRVMLGNVHLHNIVKEAGVAGRRCVVFDLPIQRRGKPPIARNGVELQYAPNERQVWAYKSKPNATSRTPGAKYGCLVLVEGIPTLLDLHMVPWGKKRGGIGVDGNSVRGGGGLRSHLDGATRGFKSSYISRFFNSAAACVKVVPGAFYDDRENADFAGVKDKFAEVGGLLVPAYWDDITSFKYDLECMVESAGLPIKRTNFTISK